jgi:hypothetical protein
MPIEKETIVERPVQHETVVADSGGGLGPIAGIIAAVVVVLFAIWLFSGGLGNNGDKSVSVDLPKVTVSP